MKRLIFGAIAGLAVWVARCFATQPWFAGRPCRLCHRRTDNDLYAGDEDSAPYCWGSRVPCRGCDNRGDRTLEPTSALASRGHSPRRIHPGTHSNLGEVSRFGIT
jgi:hypothetical protein